MTDAKPRLTKTEAKSQLYELPISTIRTLLRDGAWKQARIEEDPDGRTQLLISRDGVTFGADGEWPDNLLNAMALAIAAGEMELP